MGRGEGTQDGIEQLLRGASAALTIRFGTDAPYRIGKIRLQKVGYAGIPSLIVPVECARRDLSAIVPIARQVAFSYLAERGIANDALEFSPSVYAPSRGRRFVDENESSPTQGKNKMGVAAEIRFQMTPLLAQAVRWQGYSFGELPATWELG